MMFSKTEYLKACPADVSEGLEDSRTGSSLVVDIKQKEKKKDTSMVPVVPVPPNLVPC